MIVLDTTILVYAKGREHQLRAPCRSLLTAIERGDALATTTAEVIQEFAHVRARRHGRADASALAGDYLDLLSPLLPIAAEHVRSGLALFEQLPDLGSFDAILAAAAIDAGADALVSADRAFGAVPALEYIHPGTPDIELLLGSEGPTGS